MQSSLEPSLWGGSVKEVLFMDVAERLKDLGIEIPEVSPPLAAYVPAVKAGSLVFVSGQLPMVKGELAFAGKVGRDLTLEQGREAARLSAINCLAALLSVIGCWDRLETIVKLTGYIQSTDDFTQQPLVLNGASQLMEDVFGSQGRHSRAAIGVNSLPLNAACEIELIALIK